MTLWLITTAKLLRALFYRHCEELVTWLSKLRPLSFATSVVLFLITMHLVICWNTLTLTSAVNDECANIPAGIYHWRTGRFNAGTVNPPLARLVATFPLVLEDTQLGNNLDSGIDFHAR